MIATGRAFAPPGYLWLRKTVELPAGAPLDALALTLGPCNYVYEVFVNGMPAGKSGNFAERDYQIPRPRTFPLPAIRGSRITLAIRSLRFPNSPPRIWMGQPTGPFLLTGTTQTPKDAADAYFNRLRVTGTADLVTDHDIYRRHSQIVHRLTPVGDRSQFGSPFGRSSRLNAQGLRSEASP